MITLNSVTKIYNQKQANEFEALHNVSLHIQKGELVAIMGKSGAGKSTILHIIACIDCYEGGEYYLDDLLIKGLSNKCLAKIRNEKIGVVMQDYALVEDFTALENVMLPLDFSMQKRNNKEKNRIAMQALESVEMGDFAKKPVSKLSGGQKQRVAIARAIVNNPDLVLADEPTGALDSENADNVMKLFKKINREGKAVVIVTHDEELANQCDRIIEIVDGKIITNPK